MALDSYNISPDANDLEDQQNDEVYRRKFNLNYPIVQNNGCRQYGPPRDFRGHPPGKDCELFIHRIPKGHTEFDLLPALEKFGKVYQFRLMMDYCNQSRGYGYVVYCSLDEANRAFELLPHFIMNSGACLDVKRSYDKCRLFVGNLPQEMDPDAIKNTLKIIYPEMCNFIIHGRLSNMQKNRGFAFIDFPNHQAALRSKKKIGPGSLKLWDRQIRVVWAKEERGLDPDLMATVKTLFIRNIDLDATREFQSFVTKHFPMETILKITQVRDFAFVEFTTRLVAMQALSILSQAEFRGHSLSVEWALPSTPGVQSLQKRFDFDSILKLKCVANDWIMPVYIFGRILQSVDVQYVAVILRGAQMECTVLLEINSALVPNIHQRAAEVMVKLIELCKGMPNSNLIVKTHGNDFQLIGCFYGPNLTLQVSYDDSIHDFNEIVELAYASMVICQASPGFLHYSYHQALSLSSPFTYIHSICTPHRLFGCIPLSYRQSQPWQTKGKYTDCTVLLALVDKYTRTNFNYPSAMLRLPAVVQPLEDAQNWKHFYDVKLLTLKNNYRTSEICFGVDMNNVA